MLIISSDTDPVYDEHRKVWSSYMNSYKEIECYFIQYRSGPQAIEGNTFWLNGQESFPNILTKTIDSLDYFLKNNYDFIIRTNMSSLWNFKALLKHLETLPKQGVYNGIIGDYNNIKYISGSGFIMTSDVVKLLIENRKMAEGVAVIDDVDIGYALTTLGISCSPGKRLDFFNMHMYTSSAYDDTVYHYRVKWQNPSNRLEETVVMRHLIARINS
jgi:hypothetical protein